MKRYKYGTSRSDCTGQGTSSVCYRGQDMESGEEVAVKVYKIQKRGSKAEANALLKFRRQIEVLQELQVPLQEPTDPRLWHDQLARTKSSKVFVKLFAYSTGEDGVPGPDPDDGNLYIITELGQYTLKEYVSLMRSQKGVLPKDTVRTVSKAILIVGAALHAKGLVHLDLKPDNLMMFNGRLKLIDVDGCMRQGAAVSIRDPTISFSPVYCAPEWARFLTESAPCAMPVGAALDVWSVGMTLCELVTLDSVLTPKYVEFAGHGKTGLESSLLFMEWLGSLTKAPIPSSVSEFDCGLAELLGEHLLVIDPERRSTLAQCFSSAYCSSFAENSKSRSESEIELVNSGPMKEHLAGANNALAEEGGVTPQRCLLSDHTVRVRHKGTLWKLNSSGNPVDPTHWLKRDIWISDAGSLCYFSHKADKRLVLHDADSLYRAMIIPFDAGVRKHAFQIKIKSDKDGTQEVTTFACESSEDYAKWYQLLTCIANMDVVQTMTLGEFFDEELASFQFTVKNRRRKVEAFEQDMCEPIFKGTLWKLKVEGDPMQRQDWFQREMWLTRNGSLVYFSAKEGRALIYYTSSDVARASLRLLGPDAACVPWVFSVTLPPSDGIEFAPGEFAAESEEMRDRWLQAFGNLTMEPAFYSSNFEQYADCISSPRDCLSLSVPRDDDACGMPRCCLQ